MKFLKAIGGLFVKLWRWIKETAWVQPLLIVGAIFAIIFSIPYFSKWVAQFTFANSEAYYGQFQQSLNYETKDKRDQSQADKLTESIYKNSYFGEETESHTYDKATYGEKFFVMYVSSSCNGCEEAQPGFETLAAGWNGAYAPTVAGESFKLYTIFADEESSTDSTDPDHSAFERYLINFTDFFEEAGGRLENRPYCYNASLTESKSYEYFRSSDETNFETPTLLLVDYTQAAIDANCAGVSEVLFGVKGSNKNEKAKLLRDMWNHLDNDIHNMFSDAYVK